jgi:hypothetical protein
MKPQHEALTVRLRVMRAASYTPSPRSIPCAPTGRDIHGGDLAQHVAQPRRDLSSSKLGHLPHLLMPLRLDDEEEVSQRALGIVPVDMARGFATEAPAHHLPESCSMRPVELGSQILKLGTSHRVQAGIPAEAMRSWCGR